MEREKVRSGVGPNKRNVREEWKTVEYVRGLQQVLSFISGIGKSLILGPG